MFKNTVVIILGDRHHKAVVAFAIPSFVWRETSFDGRVSEVTVCFV